ncbi:hypothetical protein [Halonatronum saccharophilum]|uniref:hypothetical protein n=1 Tax=Halonatronum saccharophilum TaxID=150060 RepID=UPI00047F1F15|nr:hypothetical protein [Halonatronum saccharophilum]
MGKNIKIYVLLIFVTLLAGCSENFRIDFDYELAHIMVVRSGIILKEGRIIRGERVEFLSRAGRVISSDMSEIINLRPGIYDIRIVGEYNGQSYAGGVSGIEVDSGDISLKFIVVNEGDEIREWTAVNKQPSEEEIFAYMIQVGMEYDIPPEILYGIAYVESRRRQFDSQGNPIISFDCGIGMMQVTPPRRVECLYREYTKQSNISPLRSSYALLSNRDVFFNKQSSNWENQYDLHRLAYDWQYNIDAGARILLEKWKLQKANYIPTIGDGDPWILENWYFALWAYNGYSGLNNPNFLPYDVYSNGDYIYTKGEAYQISVLKAIKDHPPIGWEGVSVAKVSSSLLPGKDEVDSIWSLDATPRGFRDFLTPLPKERSIIFK